MPGKDFRGEKKLTPFSFPSRDAYAQGGAEAWQTFRLGWEESLCSLAC